MNLIVNHSNYGHNIRIVIGVCFLLIVSGTFVKFGIIDRIALIQKAEEEYKTISEQIEELKQETEEYSSVQEQYYLYTDALLSQSEQQEVDRMEVLKVIEDCAFEQAKVTNIMIQENQIILTIRSKNLSKLSEIVSNFESNELISYVSVSTATSSNQDSQGDVIANITVELKNIGDES